MTSAVAKLNYDLVLAGPVGSLDAYIQSVGAIPVLAKEDEQALANRFHENEDLDAARELVMAHLRFVGLHRLRPTPERPHSRGQRRPHEGRQTI